MLFRSARAESAPPRSHPTRTPETAAGIVSFRKPGLDATEVVRILREQNIIAAPRAGWIRTSPHFYISPAEIDRLIDALP